MIFYKKSKGFTLIELVVVFAIIGVVSSVGLFSFVSNSRRQQLLQTAATIKQSVSKMRFMSINLVKPADCTSSDQVKSYQFTFGVSSYTTSVDCTTHTSTSVSVPLPSNASFANATTGLTCGSVIFGSLRGSVRGTPGLPCSIKLTLYGQSISISVDTLGFVSYQ